jgi:hypothetical protein
VVTVRAGFGGGDAVRPLLSRRSWWGQNGLGKRRVKSAEVVYEF